MAKTVRIEYPYDVVARRREMGWRLSSEQVNCVDTSRVPPEARPTLWNQALVGLNSALPGARDSFRVDGYSGETVDGYIEKTHVGDLSVCRIEASPHRVTQHSAARGRGISVLLQVLGTSVFEQDGRRVEVSPGDCIAGDCSQTREILSTTGTTHFLILIPRRVALSYGLQPQAISCERFSSSRGLGRLSRNLVETVIEDRDAIDPEHEHHLADMVMRSLQCSLAAADARSVPDARERLVQRVRAFVHKNLRNSNLDLGMIAEALDCSKRYLHAAFAEEAGTVTQYIWSVRLESCRRELERTSTGRTSITDIAFSHGFNSSSHFSRAFKERFGLPPSQARSGPRHANTPQTRAAAEPER